MRAFGVLGYSVLEGQGIGKALTGMSYGGKIWVLEFDINDSASDHILVTEKQETKADKR